MIECNIDDMNNEFFEYTMGRLFNAGALDVFLTNIIMKKNRPAVKLSVLARCQDVDNLTQIIFKETSTIGIRKYPVEREILERRQENINTKYGTVRVKISSLSGSDINYAPEYEDVKQAASESGESIKKVYNEALKECLLHEQQG